MPLLQTSLSSLMTSVQQMTANAPVPPPGLPFTVPAITIPTIPPLPKLPVIDPAVLANIATYAQTTSSTKLEQYNLSSLTTAQISDIYKMFNVDLTPPSATIPAIQIPTLSQSLPVSFPSSTQPANKLPSQCFLLLAAQDCQMASH